MTPDNKSGNRAVVFKAEIGVIKIVLMKL